MAQQIIGWDPSTGQLVNEKGEVVGQAPAIYHADAVKPGEQPTTEKTPESQDHEGFSSPGLLDAAKTATGAMTLDPLALKKLISGVIQSPTAMSGLGAYALPAIAAWALGPELGVPVDMALSAAGAAGGDELGSHAAGTDAHPKTAATLGALGPLIGPTISGVGRAAKAGGGAVGRVMGAIGGTGAGAAAGHPYLGMFLGERLGAKALPMLEDVGQAVRKVFPGTSSGAGAAWDQAAQELADQLSKAGVQPGAIQATVERELGPRPSGGLGAAGKRIAAGAKGLAGRVKDIELPSEQPTELNIGQATKDVRDFVPSKDEFVKDPEGSAGLKGPQVIRGRSTTKPNGNPEDITRSIEKALKLSRGEPETAHLSADQLANREHSLGALRRAGQLESDTAGDQFSKVRLKKVGQQAMNAEKGSSHIIGTGYDEANQTLTVQFHNGRVYRYENITPDIAQEFARAKSKGSFISQVLRADPESFPASEITPKAKLRKPRGSK